LKGLRRTFYRILPVSVLAFFSSTRIFNPGAKPYCLCIDNMFNSVFLESGQHPISKIVTTKIFSSFTQ
jgi:hypothetical protein